MIIEFQIVSTAIYNSFSMNISNFRDHSSSTIAKLILLYIIWPQRVIDCGSSMRIRRKTQ